ncbi:hypothetical protein C0Q70_14121 [Pomacea canaliculata]|uniref:Uncharacterized protein n=1 Tax=Pomacea canaliculata TaxID=400727 RepID=A0A2T7NZ44_POMCA|nr:hypothetical protein C0Q70_14121 [Pomacea canaliculata]
MPFFRSSQSPRSQEPSSRKSEYQQQRKFSSTTTHNPSPPSTAQNYDAAVCVAPAQRRKDIVLKSKMNLLGTSTLVEEKISVKQYNRGFCRNQSATSMELVLPPTSFFLCCPLCLAFAI